MAFAALAGRQRGELFDPARVTSIHPWHVAQGALFEDVGQWKRPWYYPQAGEDMDAAVLRECAAVRESVGFMDATTLGKIEIRGKDAGEFLNRIYTNAFKKLAPGSARYGVMCRPDGMIFDDGVTLRLDEDRYFMTTTTGGAAKVLDWLEEWLQTEWPELDVHCTSVTEQWSHHRRRRAQVPRGHRQGGTGTRRRRRAGRRGLPVHDLPRNHPRLRRAGPDLPDLLLRRTGLRDQRAVLVRAEHLGSRGRRRGRIQHHPVRHRNHARAPRREGLPDRRPGHRRHRHPAGRRAWTGWSPRSRTSSASAPTPGPTPSARTASTWSASCPWTARIRLPEGTQLVEKGITTNPAYGPVPMQGFVTSSYHSAALGRSFALALIKNGRNRIGETLVAAAGDQLVDVVVAETVLFDPEGTRKDG